ncbi:GDP-mannose transporter [Raphidocelis subcapitata]|uniref:GDP-mannose transporter n=1 Tax=Raphidocelis subcapitata TaxID=307507 RepID=A0A2V0PE35_9CHLO|nr:GDP-mannose transporter [Raphidocelis subcapitata]|eukprot:GBF96160.1 GDP-mannose transporter [Raphidocelis subcapitata]
MGATSPPADRAGGAPGGGRRTVVPGVPDTLASGAAFCVTSAAMTLMNKAALSTFGFGCPTALLCFQCSATLLLVAAAAAAGLGRLPPFSWRLLRLWLPVNLLFVGMVATSFFALRYVGVAMVTVLKNLTSWMVIAGDYAFFNQRYGAGVWATLVLMLLSALAAAATDLAFHPVGYAWQMVNNAFTAAYSLWLRGVMSRMGPRDRMDELGMVVYNNAAAIPMIAALAVATGEAGRVASEPALRSPAFLAAAAGSAAMSFLISVASMWFLSCTTATTFSLVGSLNKIPLALLGMALFSAPTSANNLASIAIGLAAGVVFARAKAADAHNAGWGRGGGAKGGGGGAAAAGGGLPVVQAVALAEQRGSGDAAQGGGSGRPSRLRT